MRIAVPNRRHSEVFAFDHNGFAFTGSVSWLINPDQTRGAPIELFLEGGKNGTAIQSVARDTAVAASLALQHGTPIEVLRLALTRNSDDTPAGPLGALLDLVGAMQ
jgi:hypothetical protein